MTSLCNIIIVAEISSWSDTPPDLQWRIEGDLEATVFTNRFVVGGIGECMVVHQIVDHLQVQNVVADDSRSGVRPVLSWHDDR